MYSCDRCPSFCNASLPLLKPDLPGLPEGLRITLLSWFDHLPLIRDHQYERGSLQQEQLSHNSINKTSYAVAFVPLQTSHKSLQECISTLCTGSVLLLKDSWLWDFTLGFKVEKYVSQLLSKREQHSHCSSKSQGMQKK